MSYAVLAVVTIKVELASLVLKLVCVAPVATSATELLAVATAVSAEVKFDNNVRSVVVNVSRATTLLVALVIAVICVSIACNTFRFVTSAC